MDENVGSEGHHHHHLIHPNVFPRVSGRLGNIIDLNVVFYRNGIPTDPHAIKKISIYQAAVQPENLIAEFIIVDRCDPQYPAPITREVDGDKNPIPGAYHLFWKVPVEGIHVPNIFFDVWSFVSEKCDDHDGSECEGSEHHEHHNPEHHEHHHDRNYDHDRRRCDEDHNREHYEFVDEQAYFDHHENRLQSFCSKFWLYSDNFFMDSGLETLRIGFEPIDCKFQRGEVRTLEVGMMPLPLYDFDYNFVAPLIPYLTARISITSDQNELLIENDFMRIGLRQGSYRSNPFVLQYKLDTNKLLRGSYKYQVKIILPNGESRVSPAFNLQIS